MPLPWDKLPKGKVGRTIDSIDKALKTNSKFVKKPFIGKQASQLLDKLPFKGVGLAGAVAGPVVAAGGVAVGTAVAWAVWVKRRGAASGGYIYPWVRSIGKGK